jgi:hypothetical protein
MARTSCRSWARARTATWNLESDDFALCRSARPDQPLSVCTQRLLKGFDPGGSSLHRKQRLKTTVIFSHPFSFSRSASCFCCCFCASFGQVCQRPDPTTSPRRTLRAPHGRHVAIQSTSSVSACCVSDADSSASTVVKSKAREKKKKKKSERKLCKWQSAHGGNAATLHRGRQQKGTSGVCAHGCTQTTLASGGVNQIAPLPALHLDHPPHTRRSHLLPRPTPRARTPSTVRGDSGACGNECLSAVSPQHSPRVSPHSTTVCGHRLHRRWDMPPRPRRPATGPTTIAPLVTSPDFVLRLYTAILVERKCQHSSCRTTVVQRATSPCGTATEEGTW